MNEKYFKQKFEECGRLLNVKASQIVSLKYREMIDGGYYTELLDGLKATDGIHIKDIGSALNGHAYLVLRGTQNIVLVEHETGLEILYIASSITGLIGFVLQVGSMIANRRRHHMGPPLHLDDVEVRYLDQADNLIEEHRHDYFPYEVFLPPETNQAEIERLTKRVATLERKLKAMTAKPAKRKKK